MHVHFDTQLKHIEYANWTPVATQYACLAATVAQYKYTGPFDR